MFDTITKLGFIFFIIGLMVLFGIQAVNISLKNYQLHQEIEELKYINGLMYEQINKLKDKNITLNYLLKKYKAKEEREKQRRF